MSIADRINSMRSDNVPEAVKMAEIQPVQPVEPVTKNNFKKFDEIYTQDNNSIFKSKLQDKILQNIEHFDYENIETEVNDIAIEIIKENKDLLYMLDRKKIVKEIIEDITGFGPINTFILDSDVSEIMVNGPDQIYIEKSGSIVKTDTKFRDNAHVMQVIDKIVEPLGRRIDESSPMVDARLPDGSRVNAIIPPLAINGPTLTIRKFSKDPFTINNLIEKDSLSKDMAVFIDACVKAKLNVFVSGGTGSGKTTTLNVISSFIEADERIVTIEDAAELNLWQDHVISLESRPPNIENTGQISIRDLVKNSLRMRPDRILVGEVRGDETIDMLQAMNTGHDGSMATGHANSPRDMISRLETMVLMSGIDLPIKVIRDQISRAINIIVHQTRFKDGSRKITSITEVQGMEEDTIIMQEIYKFEHLGYDSNNKIVGNFKTEGIRPFVVDLIEKAGVTLPNGIFSENEVG